MLKTDDIDSFAAVFYGRHTMVGEECCVTTLKTAAKETPGDSVPLCCWPPRGLCRDLDEPSSQGPLLPVSLTPLGGVGEGPGNEVGTKIPVQLSLN